MKYIFICLFLNVYGTLIPQHIPDFLNNEGISCDRIRKGIIDTHLYTIRDGKLVVVDARKMFSAYKVIINEKNFYYVSKPLMKKIRRFVRRNRCEGVIIQSLANDSNHKIIR